MVGAQWSIVKQVFWTLQHIVDGVIYGSVISVYANNDVGAFGELKGALCSTLRFFQSAHRKGPYPCRLLVQVPAHLQKDLCVLAIKND